MRNTLKNPMATPLVRGFLLGKLYEQGFVLTTARIRKEMRVSKATAKRDMKKIAGLVAVTPSQPVQGMIGHMPRKARKQ